MSTTLIDMTGEKYGRLSVLRRSGAKNGMATWDCVCDCGNMVVVSGNHMRTGHTTSCGCYHIETMRTINQRRKTNGKPRNSERLYKIWKGMRTRCHNPNEPIYIHYGGRGISICTEWDDYIEFKKWAIEHGYADDLSIDRIDVDGDYEPSNCRWVTQREQANNTRRNVRVSLRGHVYTIAELARTLGEKYINVYKHIQKHCPRTQDGVFIFEPGAYGWSEVE